MERFSSFHLNPSLCPQDLHTLRRKKVEKERCSGGWGEQGKETRRETWSSHNFIVKKPPREQRTFHPLLLPDRGD